MSDKRVVWSTQSRVAGGVCHERLLYEAPATDGEMHGFELQWRWDFGSGGEWQTRSVSYLPAGAILALAEAVCT